MTDHNTEFENIHKQFNLITDYVDNKIITKQNDIENIIDIEGKRLIDKKKSIELIEISQNRLVSLNENYNKRNFEYVKMMIFTASGLAIIWLLKILNVNSMIFSFMLIIILSAITIYCFSVYVDIASRDNIYFDEIKMSPTDSYLPNGNSITKPSSLNSSSLNSSFGPLTCFGSACCSIDTAWNTETKLCEIRKK